jgi:chemotaxis protein MotB
MADANQTIIIKKIKKGHGGHHGGAWKVAYADFVTAMMAFFLLLWLLNSVTQEQLEGISNYFAPVSTSMSTSGSGGVLGGQVMGEEGAMTSSSSRPSVTMELPPPKAGTGGEQSVEESDTPSTNADEASAAAKQKELEEQQFKEAEDALRQAIESVPSLKRLAESLLIDDTPEGLRIQIVDQEGLSMFASGSAEMYLHTKKVVELVAKVVIQMPQKVSITGHTDSVPFGAKDGYGNWELSADRANASRRYFEHLKVPPERISRVIGMAAREPLLKDDPTNPRNRRLSIVLLRGTGKAQSSGNDAEKTLDELSDAPAPPAPSAPEAPAAQEIPEAPSEAVIPLEVIPEAPSEAVIPLEVIPEAPSETVIPLEVIPEAPSETVIPLGVIPEDTPEEDDENFEPDSGAQSLEIAPSSGPPSGAVSVVVPLLPSQK